MIPVITVDGPTASGKGTVASRVAAQLGFHYLDSGALYRLTAYKTLKKGIDLANEAAVAEIAAALAPQFKGISIMLDGEDVTQKIRAEEVGVAASKVAALMSVRKALTDVQKNARRAPGLVADGRDMGSVIFPDAQLKVFLTATAAARAQRRFNQLKEKGIVANIDTLTRDLEQRDRRDTERAVSPLLPAKDAKILDSSNLTIEETVAQVLQWYRQCC
ncbi:MAG: (d)CMP kinase [Candidatus Aphodousia sp.]|nr:(d)CMP kinase [Sutterella sp.]MDY2899959.1 (d)CMP kinase [Candidatus Aphodousia sp.]